MGESGKWLWENKQPQSMNDLPMGEEDEEEAVFGSGVGGISYIWPPRSYSCSFCKREFKSAQALGGHMNVHRGDRAKMKQSLVASPPNFETRPWVSSPSSKGMRVSSPRPNNFIMIDEGSLPSPQENEKKKSMAVEFDFRSGKKRDGSMSFRSVVYGDFEEEMLGCRKRKTEEKTLNFFSKARTFDDLDLELRLGDAPN